MKHTSDMIFVILHHFLPFYLTNNPKNQNSQKWKKSWRYHFTNVYYEWQSHDVWFLRNGAWWTEFFVILDLFLPFHPSNNQKNNNFEKMKKVPGDIIILQKCIKNHDHISTVPEIQCVTDMIFINSRIRCKIISKFKANNFFLIFSYFSALLPIPNNAKNQNFTKMKKTPGDIVIIQKCTKNYDLMCAIPEI